MAYKILNDVHGIIETNRVYDTKQVIEVYKVNNDTYLFCDESRHISGIVSLTDNTFDFELSMMSVLVHYDTGRYVESYPSEVDRLKQQALSPITPFKPRMILSASADAKTIKGQVHGYLTGILYLAPSDISGVQLCPFAGLAGCEIACLYTAGRGSFSNVQLARLTKTKLFNHDRELFMLSLAYSIKKVIKNALKQGLIPVIRLNGTSDIQWEKIGLTVDGIQYENIMSVFPTVQFYDYTKIPTRSDIPANYDLTFSYSGVDTFQPVWQKALKNDELKRFAVVFSNRDRMPAQFAEMPVVDG
jgi:hypothetical protein